MGRAATPNGLIERGHRSSHFHGDRRFDLEGPSGESLEQAKNGRSTEYELSCVALQVARCGYSPKAQKPQRAATRALILVYRRIHSQKWSRQAKTRFGVHESQKAPERQRI